MTTGDNWPALLEGTRGMIRTVDGLDDADLAEDSVLPGWTRAHVVAHTALNAEALAGVLDAAAVGRSTAMYPSPEARAADIEELAAADPAELRDRFLASTTTFQEAAGRMPADRWDGEFARLPGGPAVPVGAVPTLRRLEVEVHHADLGAGYTPSDWPEDFLDRTFNTVVRDREGGPSMTLRTPDGDVPIGEGEGPVITGSRAELTWWLIGRGSGLGLQVDGELPTLAPWR